MLSTPRLDAVTWPVETVPVGEIRAVAGSVLCCSGRSELHIYCLSKPFDCEGSLPYGRRNGNFKISHPRLLASAALHAITGAVCGILRITEPRVFIKFVLQLSFALVPCIRDASRFSVVQERRSLFSCEYATFGSLLLLFSLVSLNEMKSATTFPGDRSREGNAAVRDRSDAKTADDPVSWTIREEGYMTRL